MNTQAEALQMAIEQMQHLIKIYIPSPEWSGTAIQEDCYETIRACKEALAQPSWQGLSDDDAIMKLAEYHGVDSLYETGVLDFAHAIEQALKEKNT